MPQNFVCKANTKAGIGIINMGVTHYEVPYKRPDLILTEIVEKAA